MRPEEPDMASAAPLRDITANTIDLASQRAEDLVSAGSKTLHAVSDQVSDLELGAVVVDAKSHRLRTALIGLVVIALIALVVKKVAGGSDDDPTTP
jgi:hypothetical protein